MWPVGHSWRGLSSHQGGVIIMVMMIMMVRMIIMVMVIIMIMVITMVMVMSKGGP